MGLAQFSKVVLLPQGEFAAFLRATADERRTLLEKLFDISTYAGVETWLVDRRRELAATLAEEEQRLATDLARAEDVLGGVPAEVLGDGVDWGRSPESLPALVDDVRDRLDRHAVTCLAASGDAESQAAAAQAARYARQRWPTGSDAGGLARQTMAAFEADPERWSTLSARGSCDARRGGVRGPSRAGSCPLPGGRRGGARRRGAGAARSVRGLGVDPGDRGRLAGDPRRARRRPRGGGGDRATAGDRPGPAGRAGRSAAAARPPWSAARGADPRRPRRSSRPRRTSGPDRRRGRDGRSRRPTPRRGPRCTASPPTSPWRRPGARRCGARPDGRGRPSRTPGRASLGRSRPGSTGWPPSSPGASWTASRARSAAPASTRRRPSARAPTLGRCGRPR